MTLQCICWGFYAGQLHVSKLLYALFVLGGDLLQLRQLLVILKNGCCSHRKSLLRLQVECIRIVTMQEVCVYPLEVLVVRRESCLFQSCSFCSFIMEVLSVQSSVTDHFPVVFSCLPKSWGNHLPIRRLITLNLWSRTRYLLLRLSFQFNVLLHRLLVSLLLVLDLWDLNIHRRTWLLTILEHNNSVSLISLLLLLDVSLSIVDQHLEHHLLIGVHLGLIHVVIRVWVLFKIGDDVHEKRVDLLELLGFRCYTISRIYGSFTPVLHLDFDLGV